MTRKDHQRVQILDRVCTTSAAEACRSFGISRTTYDRWPAAGRRSADRDPTDQVEAVLAEAVAATPSAPGTWSTTWPSVGCPLPSGVQMIVRRHRLGHCAQRVAALAQLAAVSTGIPRQPGWSADDTATCSAIGALVAGTSRP